MNVHALDEMQFYHDYGHKDKMRLKDGYTLQKLPGAEEVFTKPDSKARWKKVGPNNPNVRVEASKGYSIYKLPEEKAPAPAPQPQPEAKKPEPKKPEPVQHSPEIQQAKERVQKYQEDVSSGEVSEQIYGKSNTGFLDKYKMNLNQ
jgi:hypothetical protein